MKVNWFNTCLANIKLSSVSQPLVLRLILVLGMVLSTDACLKPIVNYHGLVLMLVIVLSPSAVNELDFRLSVV